MTELICKLFIKDKENVKDPIVRRKYGTLVSTVCIIINLVLSIGKILVGFILGFMSVMADGFNNLSDAGSSIVSLISFKIASKPADRDHPFGHARAEYIASMVVAFLVLLISVEMIGQSVEKIFTPQIPEWSNFAVIILAVSVLCKLWMWHFNKKIGKKIDSGVMRAASADSLSDAIATLAVLATTLIFRFTGINIDTYVGIAVGILIFIAGVKILIETMNCLLGEKPSDEIVESNKTIISEYPEAIGIHDLVIHNYGPGRVYITLHIEVDSDANILQTHDSIDVIEKRLCDDLSAQCTIHMDPIVTNDEVVDKLKKAAKEAVSSVDKSISIHDFRVVVGPTHTNLIFDAEVPFECAKDDAQLKEEIEKSISAINDTYNVVLTIDRV